MANEIFIDTREKVGHAYLFKRWADVRTHRTKLDHGDYLCGFRCVEKKSADNFRNILCPSHFDAEYAKIKRAVEFYGYDDYIVVVEGNPEDFIFQGVGYSANWKIRPPIEVIRRNILKLSKLCKIRWGSNADGAEEIVYNFLVLNTDTTQLSAWNQLVRLGLEDNDPKHEIGKAG